MDEYVVLFYFVVCLRFVQAPLVQWLRFIPPTDEIGVRFPDGAECLFSPHRSVEYSDQKSVSVECPLSTHPRRRDKGKTSVMSKIRP